jgi:hypothetical protein
LGLLEVTVLGINDDLAAIEEQDVNFKLGSEANREPDPVRRQRIDDGESTLREVPVLPTTGW